MKLRNKLALGAVTFAGASSAFAVDHSTAINAAYTDGNTNVTAGVVGLIGLMAVIVGVGAIISLFRKG